MSIVAETPLLALVDLPTSGVDVADNETAGSDGTPSADRQPKGSRKRRRLPGTGFERLLGVVVLLVAWQLAFDVGLTTSETLAGPIEVWKAGWHMVADSQLQSAIWVSLQRVFWGLLIGVPVGVVLALIAGLSRIGDDIVDTPMQALRFVPVIGLQSLIVLWFGIGNTAKISLIVFGVVFPIYINTYHSIRQIDPRFHELSKVIGLGRWQVLRRVVFPGALPGFLVGLRLAVGVAWLILVFAEQINATNGIGYLIFKAQTFFLTDVILVGLATYAVLGLISDFLVRGIERKVLSWQPSR